MAMSNVIGAARAEAPKKADTILDSIELFVELEGVS
jgi:hypothetical protein